MNLLERNHCSSLIAGDWLRAAQRIYLNSLIRIDLNGQILISKMVDSEATQAIDLQWMVMACDPNSVERETCDELPVSYMDDNENDCQLVAYLLPRSHGRW